MQNRFLFKTLLFAEFGIFFMFFAVGLYLLALAQSPRSTPDTIAGMQRTSTACLIICPLWLIPTVGIRMHAAWAWWTGLVVNLLVFGIATWAFSSGQAQTDWSDMIGPGIFLLIAILHLLSRPAQWRASSHIAQPSLARK